MSVLANLGEWRDRLKEARYSGIRSVRDSNGEEITYRSDGEMKAALAALERECELASGKRPASIVYPTMSKGI
ncbi:MULTISPECIES: hypothetical protein [unclassified Mesorhizobium]|uniref:phage head-tail joining protein n=1 Tax=unclassified Mesorhizobium TaxID=325217 RepID=UPI0033370481